GGSTITNNVGSAASFFNTAAPGAKASVTTNLTATTGMFSTTTGGAPPGDVDSTAVTNGSYFVEAGTFSVSGDATSINYTNADTVGSIISQFNAASTTFSI